MAKKKAKKKAKLQYDPLSQLAGRSLKQKIDAIAERVPHIKPTGEVKDPDTGEVLFRYTEAQKVFKIYRKECEAEGIRWRTYVDHFIQPKVIAVGSMPMLIGYFCIEDIETGEVIVIGWGSGMGRNRDWSGNTAGTRALKQFLLVTFRATWEDPDDLKQELAMFDPKEILDFTNKTGRIKEMLDYFGDPKAAKETEKKSSKTKKKT